MASFEDPTSSRKQETQKFPIRRLNPAIEKFVKILQIDLERLNRHKVNIGKFQRLKEWDNLNKEQINATRTVQQLKANIKELEKTRNQVAEEDLNKFDDKVISVKHEAIDGVLEFLEIYGVSEEEPFDVIPATVEDHDSTVACSSSHVSSSLPHSSHLSQQLQLQTTVPDDTYAAESWENLKDSLVELNGMIKEFSTLAHGQQEKIDQIEDNIEKAHDNVQKGVWNLGKAAKYKAAILPVAGAVVGGIVAGPVGLYVGAKVGGIAGLVGGGIAGFAGGRFIKKKQDKATDMELQNLSSRGSQSTPDLNSK